MEAEIRYSSIINLQRPVHQGDLFSRRHPKMTNRAKIFAPFAALVGFDERIHRKEINYEAQRLLSEEEMTEMNDVLCHIGRGSHVKIVYYEPCSDPENDAYLRRGTYSTVTGTVRWVDQVGQCLVLEDRAIGFSNLYRVEVA